MPRLKKIQPIVPEPEKPAVKRRRRSRKTPMEITVSFTDRPKLYEDLVQAAKTNFRTIDEQVLYCVWKQTYPEQDEK